MKKAVCAHGFILEFLSISCAITHEIANNGTSLSIFSQLNEQQHS
ncbi:RAxF-45 family protein [Psychrobacillus sp. FSL H8-0483]